MNPLYLHLIFFLATSYLSCTQDSSSSSTTTTEKSTTKKKEHQHKPKEIIGSLPYNNPLTPTPPKEIPRKIHTQAKNPARISPRKVINKDAEKLQKQQWIQWKHHTGIYKISFPAHPEVTRQKLPTFIGEIDLDIASYIVPPLGGYIAAIYELTTPVKSEEKKKILVEEAFLLAKNHHIPITKEELSFVVFENNPGISFDAKGSFSEMGTVQFSCRIYLLENNLIRLVTLKPINNAKHIDSQRFFEAFSIHHKSMPK